jgi:hypothetical protein
LVKAIDQLDSAGLAVQILALPMLAPDRKFDAIALERAVEAYDLRNKAIHDGCMPEGATAPLVEAVLRVVGAVRSIEPYRFPSASGQVDP